MEPLLPLTDDDRFDLKEKARKERAQEQLGFELWSTPANDPRWLDSRGNPIPALLIGDNVMIVNEPLPGGHARRYHCRVLGSRLVAPAAMDSLAVQEQWRIRKLWFQANQTYQSLLRAMIATFDKYRYAPEVHDPFVVQRKDRLQRLMRKASRRVARRQAMLR